MIWYLLYPFRGTTEPPRLSPSHPLRRAFQTYGTATARHWLLSILLTVVVSVLLCYPAVFQTDSPAAAGLRNLPKHAWTSTTKIDGDRPADVDIRQVWVEGDYMNGIHPRVLRQALHVQDTLIAGGFAQLQHDGAMDAPVFSQEGCLKSNYGSKWGFHSPLMYWNCSTSALREDRDPLATINARSGLQSALNLTLRPSTVFAGKSFTNKKLRAADALVISVFDQGSPGFEHTWETRLRQFAKDSSANCSLIPEDGQVKRSTLYEFRFKPMTLNDDLFLAGSYMITAVYVVWRMMQLRAIKSWFGLLITVCAKMTICVIASFTVCTFLGVDLARIPRPFFPGVVFCFGLGNIFRLINVVLETPPEMPPIQRIGNAIGEVGHLSLAVAGQNLLLIYLLSRVVTPWVADFCVFAAVTLVLDFVFHLTFFLAVLSVDVQRLELQDSLSRGNVNHLSKGSRHERQSWLDALRQGNLPLSTRWAGSAAIISMILAVNWHFFDSGSPTLNPRGILKKIVSRAPKNPEIPAWNPPPINQARSPAEWLRIQDHNTARELFGFIKPDAHSFVARVYDPLLVVLKGAQGRDTTSKTYSLLESARHFARDHAFPAALIVVFLIAGVTLLMNYLLWSGLPDETAGSQENGEEGFSVRTLPKAQVLDVVRLTSCPKSHLVSVSLDRSVSLWVNERGTGYVNRVLQTAAMSPKLWPLIGCAMDDSGRLLALCSDNGQIRLWSLATSRFVQFPTIDLRAQSPLLFSFISTNTTTEHDKLSIVIVTPDGYLTLVEARTGSHQTRRIYAGTIISATLYSPVKGESSLVYVTKAGEVSILSLIEESAWTSEVVAGLDPGPPPDSNPNKIKHVYSVPSLGLICAIRAEEVEVFDFTSRALIHNIPVGRLRPHSFRIMHSARRTCTCGAPSIHSLSFAYNEQDSDHMLMQTFTIDDSPTSRICLGKPSENNKHDCKSLQLTKDTVHCVDPAGAWDVTSAHCIIGIRKCIQSPTPASSTSGVDSGYYMAEPEALASALKSRAIKEGKSNGILSSSNVAVNARHAPDPLADSDDWEAWTLSTAGEFLCRPLVSGSVADTEDPEDEEQLFVAAPGPIAPLGKRSVAVGFGNTVKIITVGKESFGGIDVGENGSLDTGFASYKWRARSRVGRKTQ